MLQKLKIVKEKKNSKGRETNVFGRLECTTSEKVDFGNPIISINKI